MEGLSDPADTLSVEFTYDEESDFAYLYLMPRDLVSPAADTEILDMPDLPGIYDDPPGWSMAVKFNEAGEVIGIEFGGVSKFFNQAFVDRLLRRTGQDPTSRD